jgi:hypothetical protein
MHDTDSSGREVATVAFVVSTAVVEVSGQWRGDDGLSYTVRQLGDDRLWWRGEPERRGDAWPNVAHGMVAGRTVTVLWAELPTGEAYRSWLEQPPGTRPLAVGAIELMVESDGLMVVTAKPDDCRLGRLERRRAVAAGG